MAISQGYVVPRDTVESFIASAAKERGIDPKVALEVYRREGAGAWQSSVVKNGVREPSFGPFQLYTGGGLGNKFQKETGLDPRDPNTWQKNITFALDEAKKGGWGPWYGAKAAGITGFAGIGGTPASSAPSPQSSAPVQTAQMPAPTAPGSLQGLLSVALQQPPQDDGLLSMSPQFRPPKRKPIDTSGLLALLADAPPAVRGLLFQG